MKTCTRCGATNPTDARFCSACGNALVAATEAGEERKLVTVLFSDVTGSTGLGERLDPERLKEVMTSYFRQMRAEVEAEGGTVEKFIGDAVMAVFGVPTAHEDDSARAVRAAIRMQDRLRRLNGELLQRHGVSLEMRIGINTGEAFAVNAPAAGESMVSGDVVNVAARLQQGAQPGGVVVSERTALSARGFSFREVERATLRGRIEPVTTFVLEGEAPGPQRGVPGLRAPMLGRDHEISFLDSVLDRVTAERRPHLVTVYGDPGIGKSRLVGEFVDLARIATPGLRALFGRCLPYGEGVTYWPLAEILKSHCGILDSDPPDLALDKVHKIARDLLTHELVADPPRATATLAYTMGLEDPDFDFESLSPRQVGIETRAAWGAFFSALAAEEPLVVVFEDIHWAEDALLDVLEDLARTVAGPVLFVCPARGELGTRRPTWGGGQRNFSALALDPLGPAHAAQLVRSLLAVANIGGDLQKRILERAEGNPFFLEEIIRKFIDDGTFVRTADGWKAPSAVGDVNIPDTVQATIAARIDLLEAEDKRVLQHAAVVGRVFWTGPLLSLLGESLESIEPSLDRLRDRELAVMRFSSSLAGEREYIFKHILTRDVAYESLPRRDRADAHTRVAQWMEQTAGDRRRELIELLAHHYAAAYRAALEHTVGPTDELEQLRRAAVEAMIEASTDARARLALGTAARFALDAVAIADDPLELLRAHEAAGEAYYLNYHGNDAWESFKKAVAARLNARPVDERDVANLCAKAAEIPMRWPAIMTQLPEREEVERYLHMGLDYVRDADTPERVRLLTLLAFRPFAFFYEGSTDEGLAESIAAGEEAAAMAARLGDADLESAALDGLGACYLSQGDCRRLIDICNRRLALVPRIKDPIELGDIHSMAATVYLDIGNYRRALETAEAGFNMTVADAPTGGLHCLTYATVARFALGDWNGALEHLATIVSMMGDREMPPAVWLQAWGAAAYIHEARGEPSEANRVADLLGRLKEPQSGRPGSGASYVALILARRGDFERAKDWLDRLKYPEAIPLRTRARCDFVAEAGDWQAAAQTAEWARGVAESSGCTVIRWHADRLEGRAALARGNLEHAAALLHRATTGFTELEAAWDVSLTQLFLAEVLVSLGRKDEGGRILASALAEFERLGAVREQQSARALLERL